MEYQTNLKKIIIPAVVLFLGIIFYFAEQPKEQEIQPIVQKPLGIEISESIQEPRNGSGVLEYYYYIPESVIKKELKQVPFFIAVPGCNASGKDFAMQFKKFVEDYEFILVSPTFIVKGGDFEAKISYQYPAVWSANAMNKIIKNISDKNRIEPKGLYFLGFSAGAQFAERYALLYPDYVAAASIFAPGGVTLPTQYVQTRFFYGIGSNDEDVRKQTAEEFSNKSQELRLNTTYKIYDAIHELNASEINDGLEFLRQTKEQLSN